MLFTWKVLCNRSVCCNCIDSAMSLAIVMFHSLRWLIFAFQKTAYIIIVNISNMMAFHMPLSYKCSFLTKGEYDRQASSRLLILPTPSFLYIDLIYIYCITKFILHHITQALQVCSRTRWEVHDEMQHIAVWYLYVTLVHLKWNVESFV